VSAIIAAAVGLLALQLDTVSVFFATIFPKLGIGIALFFVILIFIGFFYEPADGKTPLRYFGWILGIGVALWAIVSWQDWFGGYYSFPSWINENLTLIIVALVFIGIIYFMLRTKKPKKSKAAPAPAPAPAPAEGAS